MADGAPEWTSFAAELTGPRFIEFQMRLTAYNADRFKPGLPEEAASQEPGLEHRVASAEVAFVEAQRKAIARLSRIPTDARRLD